MTGFWNFLVVISPQYLSQNTKQQLHLSLREPGQQIPHHLRAGVITISLNRNCFELCRQILRNIGEESVRHHPLTVVVTGGNWVSYSSRGPELTDTTNRQQYCKSPPFRQWWCKWNIFNIQNLDHILNTFLVPHSYFLVIRTFMEMWYKSNKSCFYFANLYSMQFQFD